MSIGAVIGDTFGKYQKVMNTVGTIQTAKQVLDTTSQLNQQKNKYDTRLGNPGIMAKKRTWEMPKYAEEASDESTMSQVKPKKKLTKKQKIGIAAGTTLGALYLTDAISKGNALAPFHSAWSGIKQVPHIVFNKAESGAYGPEASVVAGGVKKATQKSSQKSPKDVYETMRNYSGKNNGNNKGESSGNKKSKENIGSDIFKNFANGAAQGAGVLAVHILGDKLLRSRQAKKSFDSKAVSNRDVQLYHKTKNYPLKNEITFAKNQIKNIRQEVRDIKNSDDSDKNE